MFPSLECIALFFLPIYFLTVLDHCCSAFGNFDIICDFILVNFYTESKNCEVCLKFKFVQNHVWNFQVNFIRSLITLKKLLLYNLLFLKNKIL